MLPRFPRVHDVLSLPEVQRGRPTVLAGRDQLDNPVRWVHVSELPDIAYLLQGGELILSTGIAFPSRPRDLQRYVSELTAAPASGLFIELGRRFSTLPAALVEASQHRGLPLVAFEREVRFVRITETVHSMIVDAQLDQLRASELIHRRFTELSVEGATPAQILDQIRGLTGRPVILENLAHQVLAYSAVDSTTDLLRTWERQSRFIRPASRTAFVDVEGVGGWLVTFVGARGEHWGRLLLQLDREPQPVDVTVLERGAAALALNRLVERDRETLERQTHRTLLNDIRTGNYSSTAEVRLRADSLGVPLQDRRLVSAVARVLVEQGRGGVALEARLRDAAETVATAAREARVPALVGVIGPTDVGFVLALPPAVDRAAALEGVSRNIHRLVARMSPTPTVTVGVGSAVDEVRDLQRALMEAEQVVSTAWDLPEDKLYYELPDIRIRGLLYLLRDDSRLQTFVERELALLLLHDNTHGTNLIATLEAYLVHGRNKSAAAEALGMSRPAFYKRLDRIERMLGVDLDGVEPCVSMHVALIALDVMRHSNPPDH